MTRTVLRASALFHLTVGLGLLGATWDAVYEALGLPDPDPAVFAQFAGAFAVSIAYVVWIASGNAGIARTAAIAAAIGDSLGVGIAIAWLVVGHSELRGSGPLAALTVALAVLAVTQWAIAGRSDGVSRRRPQ